MVRRSSLQLAFKLLLKLLMMRRLKLFLKGAVAPSEIVPKSDLRSHGLAHDDTDNEFAKLNDRFAMKMSVH